MWQKCKRVACGVIYNALHVVK